MSVLFAIAILCCCALVWAAVQIARHVRKAGQTDSAEPKRKPVAKAPKQAAPEKFAGQPYADPPVGGRRTGTSRQMKAATAPTREDWKYADGRGRDTRVAQRRPGSGTETVVELILNRGQDAMTERALRIPSIRIHGAARTAGLAFVASLFIAACAHVAVPLPFGPVPMTLQNFAVILVGMVLGPVGGFAACAMYLAEGAAGLPVFQPHGLGGVAQMMGPSGGYLMAYPAAAAVAGFLYGRGRSFVRGLGAAVVADVLILASGASWFATLTHMGAKAVLMATVIPFLASEAVKVVAASGLARSVRSSR